MARKVRILKQTALADGEKFDIGSCLGFSVHNEGAVEASYGYDGGMEQTFEIAPGDSKLYGFLPDGYIFDGVMGVDFKNAQNGKLTIVLFKAITEEK